MQQSRPGLISVWFPSGRFRGNRLLQIRDRRVEPSYGFVSLGSQFLDLNKGLACLL